MKENFYWNYLCLFLNDLQIFVVLTSTIPHLAQPFKMQKSLCKLNINLKLKWYSGTHTTEERALVQRVSKESCINIDYKLSYQNTSCPLNLALKITCTRNSFWCIPSRGVITLEYLGQMLLIKTQFCAPIEYFLSEIYPELKTS